MSVPTGAPTATVTDNIDATINEVWQEIANFSEWGWWTWYDRWYMPKDEVGQIRTFRSVLDPHQSIYQEKLTVRDLATHTLRYEFVSINPPNPLVKSILTEIKLDSVTSADKKIATTVTFSSWTVLNADNPTALQGITAVQNKAYANGISCLSDYLTTLAILNKAVRLVASNTIEMKRAVAIGNVPNKKWTYDDYTTPAGESLPMPRMVQGLPVTEALAPSKLGRMLEHIADLAEIDVKLYLAQEYQEADKDHVHQAGEQDKTDVKKVENNIQIYKALTGLSSNSDIKDIANHLINNWEKDTEFCLQLLQGVEPLTIKVVHDIATQVPQGLQSLKGQGKSLKELVDEKRLFCLDYTLLRKLEIQRPMYFYGPVALIYKELLDGGKSRLNILGFQLEEGGQIFTPGMPQTNRYKLARMFLACADSQIHEFIHHLGFSHLGMEPIIVSVNNALPKTHCIRKLLTPHFRETIGINFLARGTLVAKKDAFTNETFAIGTSQALGIVSEAWKGYHFVKNSFPEDLKARGFDEHKTDGLEGYYYREDGFLIWNCIGEYTTDVINHFYPEGDSEINTCPYVKDWVDEVVNNARVPGFPTKISTVKELSHVLQIIIWNASALHSILNYPQWNYLGIIPNRPNALYGPMPKEEKEGDGKDITNEQFAAVMPDNKKVQFQILFSHLLSMPSEENFVDIKTFEKDAPKVNERLHKRLKEISKTIEHRNRNLVERGALPYPFLQPELLSTSVNI